MMSTAVLYTTFDAIRAALGLSAVELPDKQMADLELDALLRIELLTVYSTHASLAAAIDAGTATPEQETTWLYLQQYCKYEAAVQFLPQFQLITAAQVGDAKATMRRFEPSNLSDTIAQISGMRDKFRTLLNPDLFPQQGDSFGVFTAVSPLYDPVTNENADVVTR